MSPFLSSTSEASPTKQNKCKKGRPNKELNILTYKANDLLCIFEGTVTYVFQTLKRNRN